MATRARTRVTALLVAAAVLVGVAGVSAVRAGSPAELPPVPPQELLASSLEALAAPFSISGDVTTHVETGLPDIPGTLGSTGTGLGGLATALLGTQHFKVWRSDDGVRIARVGDLSEQVVVANHDEAWYWDSNGMTAARLDLAALTRGAADPAWSGMTAPTRADLTGWIGSALSALAPYADVSVDPSGEIAGRPAYDLVLTPAPGPTLIGRVTVGIDAETRLPLRFSVTPKGSDAAAAEIGFDAVSFDPIDDGMFAFDPPQGARVSEITPPEAASHPEWMSDERQERPAPGDVRVFGTGFSSRIAVRLSGPVPEEARALLPYAGPLFSAIVVERGGDGWLLAGPVPVTTLERDADRLLPAITAP